MMEPTVIVLGRGRKRGRPQGSRSASEPLSSSVTTWLPDRDYARLAKYAAHHGESVSATVRTLLKAVVAGPREVK